MKTRTAVSKMTSSQTPTSTSPPPLLLSSLKANPRGGRVIVFGTPPCLERRQALGGRDNLLTLSLKPSAALQRPRPERDPSRPSPSPIVQLPPPSSFPVLSSYQAPPRPHYHHTHTRGWFWWFVWANYTVYRPTAFIWSPLSSCMIPEPERRIQGV